MIAKYIFYPPWNYVDIVSCCDVILAMQQENLQGARVQAMSAQKLNPDYKSIL